MSPGSPPPASRAAYENGIAWARAFETDRGRALRVLHVGNVANNAYLNAKFLRGAGIDAHVLSYDYYDLFATPEWEELDPRRPQPYSRPRWFVQGPFGSCIRYLEAILDGNTHRGRIEWARLTAWRTLLQPDPASPRRTAAVDWSKRRVVIPARIRGSRIKRRLRSSAKQRRHGIPAPVSPQTGDGSTTAPPLQSRQSELIDRFAEVFPDRSDRLDVADFAAWRRLERLSSLFARYDVVQCYGTMPILPLLTRTRPYVAFEHGTLRDFTLGDDGLHRLNALAYHESDHTFVTNGDCLAYAERLRIPRFSPMIHPVDVDQHEATPPGVEALRRELDADVVLLCPLRHDWAVKGTDIHLRSLPRIISETRGRVRLVLTLWGAEIDRSRALLEELGCVEHVIWYSPLPRPDLVRFMKAADVLLDQMALPHFGATAPQGLAAGIPVVMSYRPESTSWIVSEPAPILAAFDPDGVADAVRTALDPGWRAEFAHRAREWVQRHHHPTRVIGDHARVYQEILEESR